MTSRRSIAAAMRAAGVTSGGRAKPTNQALQSPCWVHKADPIHRPPPDCHPNPARSHQMAGHEVPRLHRRLLGPAPRLHQWTARVKMTAGGPVDGTWNIPHYMLLIPPHRRIG